jgi:hypothetical protein
MKCIHIFLACVILFSACKNDNKAAVEKKTDVQATAADVKGMTSAADERNQRIDRLKKMPELSLEQLSSFLPQVIDSVKKTNYNASSTVGYSFAAADYVKNKNTRLQVNIYDCSGEGGSTWFSTTYLDALNVNKENDEEYTKTIDMSGTPAIETYNRKRNQSTLTYVVKDQVMIILAGRNMKPDELKEAAKEISVKI